MTIEFQLTVDHDNTINNLNGFYVPIIAERIIGGGVRISTGQMMIHEIIEVIDWIKVHEQAERLASECFNQLLNEKAA